MKQEELKVKNLCAIEDETLKYIFVTIMKGKDFVKDRAQLSEELGLSKRKITAMYREATQIVKSRIEENRRIEFQKYVNKCYGDDGFLVLDYIAKCHKIESEELKKIFTDYVESFTDEESHIADMFGFSLEALKKGNVQTLQYRVRGFSEELKRPYELFYNNVKKQDVQFLGSVSSICNDYYRKNNSNDKQKTLVKKDQ